MSNKKTLDLINYEGPVLKLLKTEEGTFVVYDQWDSIVDILTLSQLFEFLDGNLYLTDSESRTWSWATEHNDAKAKFSKLFNYINNE